DGLPPLHARLASGCWSQLCRTGFDPQGFYERFLSISARPPFPSFHGASFVLALFCRRQLPAFSFTDHRPLFPCPTLHSPAAHATRAAVRRGQRSRVVRGLPPPWLLPDTD